MQNTTRAESPVLELSGGGAYKKIWVWDKVHAQALDGSDFDFVKLLPV